MEVLLIIKQHLHFFQSFKIGLSAVIINGEVT